MAVNWFSFRIKFHSSPPSAMFERILSFSLMSAIFSEFFFHPMAIISWNCHKINAIHYLWMQNTVAALMIARNLSFLKTLWLFNSFSIVPAQHRLWSFMHFLGRFLFTVFSPRINSYILAHSFLHNLRAKTAFFANKKTLLDARVDTYMVFCEKPIKSVYYGFLIFQQVIWNETGWLDG